MADAWSSVVETEPEWDDTTRGLVEGLALYHEHVHRCGFHQSILDDPETYRFTFATDECEMCAAFDVKRRVMAEEEAAWAKAHEGASPKDRRPGDGRTVVLRSLTPEEFAEAEAKKKAKGPREDAGTSARC